MSTPSPINVDPSRHLIVRMGSAVIAVARLLLFGVLMFFSVIILSIVFPPARLLLGQPASVFSDAHFWLLIAVLYGSCLAIGWLARSPQMPDRASWSGVHAGILAIALAALIWAPQEAGFVAGGALLLTWTPLTLRRIAYRRARAGYTGAAAFYLRLACVLHPSSNMRFQSAFWGAQALGQIEKKVVAYRALALRSPPEQLSLLKLQIPLAYGDWEGVLAQIRSADELLPAMKWLEIRAFGELGRIDDMVKTYASLGPDLSPIDLRFCRLFVLAFSGRINGVRALLRRHLGFLRPRSKAYWVFVAGEAAGTDEDARRALASHAREAEDETFRVNAQRHLDEAPTLGKVALSMESLATIAAIEERFRR
jgi:hypothetical protein